MLQLQEKPITMMEMLYVMSKMNKKGECENKYRKVSKKKLGEDKGTIYYLNFISAFDIEDTHLYHKEKKEKKERLVPDAATMYIWQFGFMGYVTLARTWSEFIYLVEQIHEIFGTLEDRRFVIWVHNLAHEWAFINKLFEWDEVFAKSEREPLRASTVEGIEFRCSYALSGSSLEYVGKELVHMYEIEKMEGDLDYSLLRGKTTPLTPKEIKYCVHDVLVVMAYIDEVLTTEKKTMASVRMTSTGLVREYLKLHTVFGKFGEDYQKFIQSFTLSEEEYYMLKQASAGGLTHACMYNAGREWKDVDSWDITSSYPTVLCSELYPMGKPTMSRRDFSEEEILSLKKKKKLAVFFVKFKGLESICLSERIISKSKGIPTNAKGEPACTNVTVDNGRVIAAETFSMVITSVDLENFKRFYKWESVEIYNVLIYPADYLPKSFIWCILKFYKDKTELKGLDPVKYGKSKALLNAIFGDTDMDPVRSQAIYGYEENGKYWKTEAADIKSELEKYNNRKSRYNHYSWGVFCCSYARYNLCSAIKAIDETSMKYKEGCDYIYSDTDSAKFKHGERHIAFFEEYNKEIQEKIRKCLEYRHLDPEMACPKDKDGIVHPLGVWDHETADFKDENGEIVSGKYKRFKTMGAKRYMYTCDEWNKKTKTVDRDVLHITVAGCHKKKGAEYFENTGDPYGNFDFGTEVPAEKSGRLTAYYRDDHIKGTFKDNLGNVQEYEEESCVILVPTPFTLKHESIYEALLYNCRGEHESGCNG